MDNIYELVKWPDERLTMKAEIATEHDDVCEITSRMFATIERERGIGLAGNQVGILKRIIVVNIPFMDGHKTFKAAMINPEIIQKSQHLQEREEGCLSFPGINAKVSRPADITVKWNSPEGVQHQVTLSGLAATCVQHEIDHLDGITYPHRLSPFKRQRLIEQYQKKRKMLAKHLSNSI